MISPAEEVGMLWLSRKIMFHFLNNTWFFYSKNFSVYSLYNWNLVKQHNKNTRRCLGNSDLLVPGCVQAHALGWKDLPQGWRGPALLTLTASSEEEEKSPYCPRTVNVFKAAQNLRPWRRERPGVGDPHGDTGVPDSVIGGFSAEMRAKNSFLGSWHRGSNMGLSLQLIKELQF